MALRPGHRVAEYRDDPGERHGRVWPGGEVWRYAGSWMRGLSDWPPHRWRVLDEDDYCEPEVLCNRLSAADQG